jgi:hypothetical protein
MIISAESEIKQKIGIVDGLRIFQPITLEKRENW